MPQTLYRLLALGSLIFVAGCLPMGQLSFTPADSQNPESSSGVAASPSSTQTSSASSAPDVCSVTREQTNSNLSCPAGQVISKIVFANYGDPVSGSCGSYVKTSTTCGSGLSQYIVEKACLGQTSCSVGANNAVFGNDPCDPEVKTLTVDAQCAPQGTAIPAPVQPQAPTLNMAVSNPPTGQVCATAQEQSDASLTCPAGQVISKILFASYGTPGGSCGAYSIGFCHAGDSVATVESICLGKSACTVGANYNVFWGDPCDAYTKALAIQAQCSPGP